MGLEFWIRNSSDAPTKEGVSELLLANQISWGSMPKNTAIETTRAGYFDHEKWDVYQAALELVILISEIVEQLPRGKAYLADQLQRAGTSIPLNIAEGSGEDAISEKARFYRMARRSATECASILDVCHRLRLLEGNRYAEGRALLLRIVAMLTKMGRAETGYTRAS